MTTDSFVRLPTDGTGKSVATQEVTRADGTVVELQQILEYGVVNDTPTNNLNPGDVTALSVTGDGRLRVSTYPASFETKMQEPAEQAMWGLIAQSVTPCNSPW